MLESCEFDNESLRLCCSRVSHSPGSSTAESFPSHWDKIDPPDYEYKVLPQQTLLRLMFLFFFQLPLFPPCSFFPQLIPLSKSAKEYDNIATLFHRTMPKSNINTIQRIQNPCLWKAFQW